MKAVWLALKDLRHDSLHFFCAIVLIGAILGPILVLIGIKTGAVAALFSDMRTMPDNRSVFIQGNHLFTGDDVATVRSFPEVAFAEGQNTVSTTGTILLIARPDGARGISGGYGTTGPGDPLTTQGGTLKADEIILSAAFARRLGSEVGGDVALVLERGSPRQERIEQVFRIAEILPQESAAGNYALLTAEAIDRIEAYGLGFQIPAWGIEDGKSTDQRINNFEKIRIYAKDLEDLPALVSRLEAQLNVQTSSRQNEVRAIIELETSLNSTLAFLSVTAMLGMIVVLSALFWSAVRRKKSTWCMLSLIGLRPVTLAFVPVVQAIVVSVFGYLCGLALYAAAATTISAWFASVLESGQAISVLPLGEALFAGAVVLLSSIVASAFASFTVLNSDPAETIRNA